MLGGVWAGGELGTGRISMTTDILGPSDLREIFSHCALPQRVGKLYQALSHVLTAKNPSA